jgi:hypothetical protein
VEEGFLVYTSLPDEQPAAVEPPLDPTPPGRHHLSLAPV